MTGEQIRRGVREAARKRAAANMRLEEAADELKQWLREAQRSTEIATSHAVDEAVEVSGLGRAQLYRYLSD
jgi:transcriptional regulator NrdR family protein